MTNIKCKGGKEIDLLAINPKTLEKFHVEARVTTGFKIRTYDTHVSKGNWKGRAHKIGLDFFHSKKFNHPTVKNAVYEIFGDLNYRKMLVIWDVQDLSLLDEAKEKFDIEILFIDDLLRGLIEKGKTKGSRDDILRIVELMRLLEEETRKRKMSKSHIRRLARLAAGEPQI